MYINDFEGYLTLQTSLCQLIDNKICCNFMEKSLWEIIWITCSISYCEIISLNTFNLSVQMCNIKLRVKDIIKNPFKRNLLSL